MIKRLTLAVLGVLLAVSAFAQSPSISGPLTATSCPAVAGCLTLSVQGLGAIGVQVSGTYVGTIAFESTVNNTTYTALALSPTAAGATATGTTSTGAWTGAIGGVSIVRVRMSAYTSGTATVTIQGAGVSSALLQGSNTWCCTQTFNNETVNGTLTINGTCVGCGGGTIGGSIADTQVAFGTGVNTIGGSSLLTWASNKYLQVGPTTALVNDNFDALWSFGNGTLTTCPGQLCGGMYVDAELVIQTDQDSLVGAFTRAEIASGSTHTGYDEAGHVIYVSNRGSGLLTTLEGTYLRYQTLTGASTTTQAGMYVSMLNRGTVGTNYGFYVQAPQMPAGTVGTNVAFYAAAQSASGITNPYSFWADDQGVFRIRSDNTFNSVYQAIPALYNPQFTKYTPGAANYERCIPGCQWNGNVGEIGNEKGGTGTLRDVRLIGSHLKLDGLTTGPTTTQLLYNNSGALGGFGSWDGYYLTAIAAGDFASFTGRALSDGFAGDYFSATFTAQSGDKKLGGGATVAGTTYQLGTLAFEYNDTTDPSSFRGYVLLNLDGAISSIAPLVYDKDNNVGFGVDDSAVATFTTPGNSNLLVAGNTGNTTIRGTATAVSYSGVEMAAPSAPAANGGVIFFQDSGGGKTQACARFNTGAVQCFAVEP